MVEKDHNECALLVRGLPVRANSGRKCRQRTAALRMIAVLGAQVRLHNRLPTRLGSRLLRSLNQRSDYFPERFTKQLQKQIVLAPEMFVRTSVGEDRIPHNGCNRSAMQAL